MFSYYSEKKSASIQTGHHRRMLHKTKEVPQTLDHWFLRKYLSISLLQKIYNYLSYYFFEIFQQRHSFQEGKIQNT